MFLTKFLVFLAVINACRAGVIPNDFNAKRNVKVKNARLKWIEWKKLNLVDSRNNISTEESQGMENGRIFSSTESMKPIVDTVIEDDNRLEDSVRKFRKLNEQGIFGAQFWDKDSAVKTESDHQDLLDFHLPSNLWNASKIEYSLNETLKDGLDLTKVEENAFKDIKLTPSDSNEILNVTTPEGSGVEDLVGETVLNLPTRSIHVLEDNQDLKVHNNFLTYSDKSVDLLISITHEKDGVTESNIRVMETSKAQIKAVATDENIDDVNDGVNLKIMEVIDPVQTLKSNILLNDANSADILRSVNADEFQEWVTEAKNSKKKLNDSDSLNSTTESENIAFKLGTDLNIHSNRETAVTMQANTQVFTKPESGNNELLDSLKLNDSVMLTAITEFNEPSELTLSELIENVKNVSGILDSFNLNEPIGFEVVTENISSINAQSVDETQVLNGGSEITFFPEEQAGSEFLLDSEIAKNLLIREMLSTPGFLESEITDHTNFINKQSSNPGENTPKTESELLLTAKANLSEPIQNKLNISENSFVFDSSTEVLVTEHINVSANTPLPKKCPLHRTCIFWFFGRDTCTSHDECGISEMCCQVTCSKRCVKV